jgi:hypothetical protein
VADAENPGVTKLAPTNGKENNMDMRALILDLEASLLKPDVRSDHQRLNTLLADDFVEFGATGQVWTKPEIVAAMEGEISVVRVIDDFVLRHLASDVALATYLCHHTFPGGSGYSSRRSSIWREGADGWQMVFHQGTQLSGT